MSLTRLVWAFFAVVSVGSAGTYTAASCSRSDVNAVINGPTNTAVDGDVIQIPAGSCTWTSGITIPSGIGITIKGSGTPNSTPSTFGASASCSDTLITDNSNTNLFNFRPNASASLTRLSCLKIRSDNAAAIDAPITAAGVCNATTCSKIRFDNITIDPSMQGALADSGSQVLIDNVFGVIDHVTMSASGYGSGAFQFLSYNFSAWEGVGSYGDNSRSSPSTMGTEKTVYLENNLFGTAVMGTETEAQVPFGGQGGGRVALRFNDMTSARVGLSNHGTDTNGRPRGPLQGEFYGNTFVCNAPSLACQLVGARSGSYMVFGNSATAGTESYYNSYVDLAISRKVLNPSPWGLCDGTGAYDDNTASPAICIDQPSRSGGTLLSGSTPSPTGWPDQFIEPTYVWNNSGKPASFGSTTSNPSGQLLANRDFYTDGANGSPQAQTSATSPFNGTSGVGFGTLAFRPTTCTTGVGYYATDQGNWNQSGNSFGQGQLYKCTSTNTWTLSYTPYTYPHPLISGGEPPATSQTHTGGRITGGRQ